MTDSNVDEYNAADADLSILAARLKERAAHTQRDPESLVAFLRPELSDPDRRVVDDVAIRRLLAATYSEAVRHGADGWIDDAMAFRKNWGVDFKAITAPVLLWHGADDRFSPVSHTRWLARQIHTAEVEVRPGLAHFGAVEILPRILNWLISREPTPRGDLVSVATQPPKRAHR
jgi:pimeloyl-ACP methyl ester carboxylesterase